MNSNRKPRVRNIIVIRNGVGIRQVKRILISEKYYKTMDAVKNAVGNVIRLDSGHVKKIYTSEGGIAKEISDIFSARFRYFIAVGNEKVSTETFQINAKELVDIQKLENGLSKSSGTLTQKQKIEVNIPPEVTFLRVQQNIAVNTRPKVKFQGLDKEGNIKSRNCSFNKPNREPISHKEVKHNILREEQPSLAPAPKRGYKGVDMEEHTTILSVPIPSYKRMDTYLLPKGKKKGCRNERKTSLEDHNDVLDVAIEMCSMKIDSEDGIPSVSAHPICVRNIIVLYNKVLIGNCIGVRDAKCILINTKKIHKTLEDVKRKIEGVRHLTPGFVQKIYGVLDFDYGVSVNNILDIMDLDFRFFVALGKERVTEEIFRFKNEEMVAIEKLERVYRCKTKNQYKKRISGISSEKTIVKHLNRRSLNDISVRGKPPVMDEKSTDILKNLPACDNLSYTKRWVNDSKIPSNMSTEDLELDLDWDSAAHGFNPLLTNERSIGLHYNERTDNWMKLWEDSTDQVDKFTGNNEAIKTDVIPDDSRQQTLKVKCWFDDGSGKSVIYP